MPGAIIDSRGHRRLVESFWDRVIGIDEAVADRWGMLNVPDLPAVDGLLAATAAVHGFTLVTRNVRDVQGAVPVVNPFEPGS